MELDRGDDKERHGGLVLERIWRDLDCLWGCILAQDWSKWRTRLIF